MNASLMAPLWSYPLALVGLAVADEDLRHNLIKESLSLMRSSRQLRWNRDRVDQCDRPFLTYI